MFQSECEQLVYVVDLYSRFVDHRVVGLVYFSKQQHEPKMLFGLVTPVVHSGVPSHAKFIPSAA